MKKIMALLLIMAMLTLSACGENLKAPQADGSTKVYETYGLFNESEVREEGVEYKLIFGNVVWGILLGETIIAPVYFFGFSLYEPVAELPGPTEVAPNE